MPNHEAIHNNRNDRIGEVVSLFLHFIIREDLTLRSTSGTIESIFLEIHHCSHFGGKHVITGCVYRPPGSHIDMFSDALSHTWDLINAERK